MRFLLELALIAVAFGVGHWSALHPAETRTFWERLQAAAGRIIHRNP